MIAGTGSATSGLAASVELHGRVYPSAEHAYQALKFPASIRGRFAVGATCKFTSQVVDLILGLFLKTELPPQGVVQRV